MIVDKITITESCDTNNAVIVEIIDAIEGIALVVDIGSASSIETMLELIRGFVNNCIAIKAINYRK